MDTDRLFCKDAEAYVKLELASLTIDPSAVSAIGLEDATDLQWVELKATVDTILSKLPPGLGRVEGVKHEIHVWNARPIKQRRYPVPDKVQEEMHRQVCEMLNQGIIEPSKRGWSSPAAQWAESTKKCTKCLIHSNILQIWGGDRLFYNIFAES